MKKFKLSNLLVQQMINESSYLKNNIYPEIYNIKLSREAKKILANNFIFNKLVNNIDIVDTNFVTENYLFSVLENSCSDINIDFYFKNRLLLFSIPIFARLLNSRDPAIANMTSNLFFKIHCANNLDKFFLEDTIDCAEGFDFHFICGLEHLLTVKDTDLGVASTLEFLNFANFERTRKILFEDDNSILYRKKLDDMYDSLYRYFSFIASDDVVAKFDSVSNKRDGWKVKYSKNELNYDNSNFELVKFYYGGELNYYVNKYYQFKEMEEKMMIVGDEQLRKEMLLASFCYSEFCCNDFFRSFDDVNLTLDDLVKFVQKYEEAGNEFTERQAKSLLESFTKRYFYSVESKYTYEEEREIIKQFYNNYYNENFAFSDFEFIEHFNNIFKEDLCTFNFYGKTSKLDYYILRSVLDEKYIGFEKLRGTNLFERYLLEDHKGYDISYLMENEEASKQYRYNLFNKIYPLISQYNRDKVTLEYFLRKNVDEEELDIAREIFIWSSQDYLRFFSDDYQEIKQNTVDNIRKDFYNDLLSHPLNQRKSILLLYKDYIVSDGVSDIFTEKDLNKEYRKNVNIYYSLIIDDVVNVINNTLGSGENLYFALIGFSISTEDFRYLINKAKIDICVYERYKEDKQKYLQENSKIKEFSVEEDQITPKKVSKKCNMVIDNVNDIIESMRNGILMPNGKIRKYTYFDLLMQVGEDIRPGDAWELLFKENSDIADREIVNEVFIRTFSNRRYSIIELHKELPFERNIRDSSYSFGLNGETHVVTDEEREIVISFLNKNNFPMFVYYDAVRSYLNGEFDPDKPLISHINTSLEGTIEGGKILAKISNKN